VSESASFAFSLRPLEPESLSASLADPACGGFASFAGWVRDANEGQRVLRLDYEAYPELALKEGMRIVDAAITRFGVHRARCVHRLGALAVGEIAVWVGVAAPHRAEAFAACRFIIDEVKHRVPIWKKEYYAGGDSGWVNCEACAAAESERAEAPVHTHAPRLDADYSRQMRLPGVGVAGQARLAAARVLVIGAGGLGAPVLGYLAGAGVGVIAVMDGDALEPSNLHRQTIYARSDVGQAKATLAARHLRALNPTIEVRSYAEYATAANLRRLAPEFDLLVDCSDNFATKFLLNDIAHESGVPVLLASVHQYEGQLQLVRPAVGSCLRCIWPTATPDGLVGNCAEAGVLGPVPGVLGSLEALEALKYLLGLPGVLADEVLLVDLLSHESRRMRAPRAVACVGGRCARLPAASSDPDHDLAFDSLGEAREAGFVIIDIRDALEREQLPASEAALRIPMVELLEGAADLDRDRDYLLLCARGTRSHAAAISLRARGLDRVWSFRGGLAALPSAVS
jgi:molybdopterin/thiamine biosynthesis adenylyltransferase/molybdopterin synthase catalytic subunit/rhodanese-related sulfurtransferase